MSHHEDFDKIIKWVRLYRAVGALKGETIGLKEAKEAWNRTHPKQSLANPENDRMVAARMNAKIRWIKDYRAEHQCTLRAAIAAHRDIFGY